MLQGTDSGAVPVLHMESWPPGEPALVLQNFTLWTHLPLTVSKVSCADGFPSVVLHLLAASHTLTLSSRSCPCGVGSSPALISSHILVCKKARNTGFLNDFGF